MKMQNSDESTIKAMKAIAALAQVKAVAEELQVDGSVAMRIVEEACGGARVLKGYLRALENACGGEGAVSEAQGTGRKAHGDLSWLALLGLSID